MTSDDAAPGMSGGTPVEDLYRSTVLDQTEFVIRFLPDGTLTAANPAYCRWRDRSLKELIGTSALAWLSPENQKRVFAKIGSLTPDTPVLTTQNPAARPDGGAAWEEWTDRGVFDAAGRLVEVHAVGRDITHLKTAELEVRRMNRALQLLSAANRAITRADDEKSLLQAVCREAVDVAGYRLAWVGYAEEGPAKMVRPVATAGEAADQLNHVTITWGDEDTAKGPTGTAIRTGQICIVRDVPGQPVYEPWRRMARAGRFVATACLPLIVDGVTIGALCIHAADMDAFDALEMQTLGQVAGDLAIGISAMRSRAAHVAVQERLRDERRLLRTLIDNMPQPIYAKDCQSRFLFGNWEVTRVMGAASPDDLVGKTDFDFYPPGMAAEFYADDQRVIETGEPLVARAEPVRSGLDGNPRWVLTTKIPLRNDQGDVVGLVGTAVDITDRRRVELELESERRMLRTVIDTIPASIFVKDRQSRFLLANNAVARVMGAAAPEELLGKTDFDFYPKEIAEHFYAAEQELMTTGEALVDDEEPVRTTVDGDVVYIIGTKYPLYNNDGEIVGMVGITRDVTEQRKARQKISELARFPDENPNPVMRVSIDGVLLYANSAAELFNVRWDCQVGQRVPAEWSERVSTALSTNQAIQLEVEVEGRLFQTTLTPIPDGDYVNIYADDITYRKEAEVALERERTSLRTVVDAVPEFIFLKDREGRFVLCNETVAHFMGAANAAELLGKTDFDYYPQDVAETFWADEAAVMASGEADINREENTLGRDGVVHSLLVTNVPLKDEQGRVTGMVGIGRDVTDFRKVLEEKDKLQSQLLQSQKMEAIGQLTAGIAHDFNNMLTAINGFAELLQLDMAPDDPHQPHVEKILESGERAANLVRQLMVFSRREVREPQLIKINDLVANMENMLCRTLGEHILLDLVLPKNVWSVYADPSQIEQVIVNLSVNARDAMPDGGRLTIETANISLGDAYAHDHLGVLPGDYVMLAVSDTGSGMSEAVKSHLFEPFFTTKARGKGTGLGLSTVYGIVKASNGHIWVYSEVGQGTTFKVYLPRVQREGDAQPTSASSVEMDGGSETILVVEDDDTVRGFVQRVLVGHGYTVLAASSGAEALEIAPQQAIDMLITDVVIPDMHGPEIARRFSEIHPDAKTLFVSGYTENAIAHHQVLDEGVAFLQKPLSVANLVHKIRQVLETR